MNLSFLQIQRILGYGECSSAVPLLKNDSNVCGSIRYKREGRGVGSSGEFNDLVQSNKKFKKFIYSNKIFKLIKKFRISQIYQGLIVETNLIALRSLVLFMC